MEISAEKILVDLLMTILGACLVAIVTYLFKACLFKACKKDHAQPVAQPDVEMGTVTGGEEIDHPASFLAHWHLASSDDTRHERDPELMEDTASLRDGLADSGVRANKPEADRPTVVDHLVTDHEIIEVTAPVVVDISHAQQVEVLT